MPLINNIKKMIRNASCLICLLLTLQVRAADPLPSWNDTTSKHAITAFVERVTDKASDRFVPRGKRIAVFDNDGTLWCEQPIYTQLQFAMDRLREVAREQPRLKRRQPFKKLFAASSEEMVPVTQKELVELIMVSHAGMTTDEFSQSVRDWLAHARHPKTERPYTEMVYQPMLELLAYLRESGFKTYIVSGGGVEFMRVFAEEVYGVPPEQVLGSTIKTRYEVVGGKPALIRLPELDFINDKGGKPVGINQFVGRKPIAAFGNSDGDFEMLEWTTAGERPGFGLIVHHDDAEREFAYDRASHVGQLARALDEASAHGWTVVSMKNDWKTIFPDKGQSR